MILGSHYLFKGLTNRLVKYQDGSIYLGTPTITVCVTAQIQRLLKTYVDNTPNHMGSP